MIIELNLNTENQNHQGLLSSLVENSEESVLCSGWLKIEGVRRLEPSIRKAVSKKFSVSIISNVAHTQKRAAKLIKKWPSVQHFMTKQNARTLHSKIYYFRTGKKFTAIVGSANITEGGLVSSDEASLKISGTVEDDFHSEIKTYLDNLASQLQ
ncbi:MAG: phospholipase D-like domain-containing protein [Halomonadaceae bacterium]|uniref:NgoFVII family restriction endonuclease n=1 Tax=Halomonas colorata TaxID=2742615 RepID=A0ABR9FY17_9GAMM|nr:phospholipase D family protein [Halomonas colorata]MBE0463536.1 NgoFVII family restriction endonuclease [Halomonas colorata]